MKNRVQAFDHLVDLAEAYAGARVDKAAGVIHDVVILTAEKVSHNKTFYTKKALQEAVSRYEGAKMYLDHGQNGGGVRSVRDFGGVYKNLRLEENFLKADLHVSSSPLVRDVVFPLAEAKAGGLSIRDRGKGREEDGVFLVEGFAPKGPFSIDLVTEPSVNKSLFESKEEEVSEMKIEELTLEMLGKDRADLVEQIKAEERKSAVKEFEEKIQKGEKAEEMLLSGQKLVALAEAGFPAEVATELKKAIEPKAIGLEEAKTIIATQKTILEKFGKSKKNDDPAVRGHGGKTEDVTEGTLPSDEDLLEAISY